MEVTGLSPLCPPPDWHRLRMAGVVVAAVLCVAGVIVLLSECHRRVPVSPGEGSSCHPGGPHMSPGGVWCHRGGVPVSPGVSWCHQGLPVSPGGAPHVTGGVPCARCPLGGEGERVPSPPQHVSPPVSPARWEVQVPEQSQVGRWGYHGTLGTSGDTGDTGGTWDGT